MKLTGATWNWSETPALKSTPRLNPWLTMYPDHADEDQQGGEGEEEVARARKLDDSLHAIFLQVTQIFLTLSTSS